jgi:hypothetical protein
MTRKKSGNGGGFSSSRELGTIVFNVGMIPYYRICQSMKLIAE